jgi:2-C-methyl-D-erythritol 2,4-cyclodiphosphate synthase
MAGVDSLSLLTRTATMALEAGWQVAHVDATVVVESIRIAPHRDEIRTKLAASLGIDVDAVSVKATTTDGLGFIGRGEGLAAVAVVTVTALP